MAELVLWPDPRLSEVCDEVPKGMGVSEIVCEMEHTMERYRGVGLAAPQIGEMLRIIIGCWPGVWGFTLINPTIKKASTQMSWSDEGCLSLPETCQRYGKDGCPSGTPKTVRVRRHKRISVRGFNERWEPVTVTASGQQAACLQHEINHLDGITLDYHRRTAEKGLDHG